jgi:outer membrane protein assembly factor BamB
LQWSVPVPTIPTGNAALNGTIMAPLSIRKIGSGVVLMGSFGETGEVTTFSWQKGYQTEAGYDANTGQLLWGPINRTYTPWTRINMGRCLVAMDGVYNEYEMETFTMTGYSLKTGQKLWGPTEPFNTTAWAYYEVQAISAYGNIYINDFGGNVHAYALATGEHLWDWNSGSSGYETPYGIWPILKMEAVADGKVYVSGGHMYSPPLFRGSRIYALNATTGEEIWNILDFPITNSATAALADGYMVEANAYDNQIYCFGKGQTATTVAAPDTVQPFGTSILIKGRVNDQSPGAMGTPAISDESMSPWMEYVYMQQPKPTNATGVTVLLQTIDPNGNLYDIGTATSDSDGLYSLLWEPPVPGKYTIIATFAGSESYWPSHAETALGIAEEPQATVAPTAPPAPMTDTYVLGIGTAIIIVVLAVGIVLVLIVRKR